MSYWETAEMIEWLRVLVTLTEDQGLAFNTHVRKLTMITPAPGGVDALCWRPRAPTHMWVGTHTNK